MMRRFLSCAAMAALAVLFSIAPASAQIHLPPSVLGAAGGAATAAPAAGEVGLALAECGMTAGETRAYARGGAALRLTLFTFRDTTSAYAGFSLLRHPDMKPAGIGEFSMATDERLLVLAGQFVLQAEARPVSAWRAEIELLARLYATQADPTPYPTLANYLPISGLIQGSESFALGPRGLNRAVPLAENDWLGLYSGAEAQAARYRGPRAGEEVTLLLVSYPTPQHAKRQAALLTQWFRVGAIDNDPPGSPQLYLRRISSLLAVVAGTGDEAFANGLLERVQYDQQVTLNEPGFRATEKPITYYILNILVSMGSLLVFFVVASLAFGGVRLFLKRLLPGKVFDRDKEVEVLQLGLGSKPIEAKDFY